MRPSPSFGTRSSPLNPARCSSSTRTHPTGASRPRGLNWWSSSRGGRRGLIPRRPGPWPFDCAGCLRARACTSGADLQQPEKNARCAPTAPAESIGRDSRGARRSSNAARTPAALFQAPTSAPLAGVPPTRSSLESASTWSHLVPIAWQRRLLLRPRANRSAPRGVIGVQADRAAASRASLTGGRASSARRPTRLPQGGDQSHFDLTFAS